MAAGSSLIEILVVDDDEGFAKLVKANLEARGRYRVLFENNSSRALSDCLNCQPDVVLLDALMPEMDGEDVYREIKAHERLRETPVIFISGLYPARRQEEGRMQTEHGHIILSKPVTTNQLVEAIEYELTKRIRS